MVIKVPFAACIKLKALIQSGQFKSPFLDDQLYGTSCHALKPKFFWSVLLFSHVEGNCNAS